MTPPQQDGGGAHPDPESRSGGSVYDRIRLPANARRPRLLLGLAREGLGLVWSVSHRLATLTLGAQLLVSLGLVAQLLLIREVISVLLGGGGGDLSVNASAAVVPMAGLALVLALISFAETLSTELTVLLGELVGRKATAQVTAVATAVELEAFEEPEFFDRLERARFNAGARNVTLAQSVVALAGAGLASVGIAVTLFTIQPLMVLLVLVAAPSAWLAASRNSREMHALQERLTPLDRERSYLLSALSGRDHAKEIRAFGIGDELTARHDALYALRIKAIRELVTRNVRRALGADFLRAMAIAATLGLMLWLLDNGRMSLPGAGVALVALLQLALRLRTTLQAVGSLYESALFLDDVRDFLALEPETGGDRGAMAPLSLERIAVENVSFVYPGARKPALDGIDLVLRRGEVVALVGENGSGKTTLAKLLAFLHEPTSGRITWDGRDAREFDSRELRLRVSVLFQDFVRWCLTARDNIGLGQVERLGDEEGIRAAARDANADGFLGSLHNGYDTILSRMFPGGRDLSGGQWQRLALGRTLFRGAPLLILDEPAAALDAVAEAALFESLRALLDGRTALFVSHRFSSVRLADRIYVLENGRVIEEGDHAELMARGGSYARMFTLQASAYADDLSVR